MPTNIFIDTSTYLSFYAVSNDDLAQLEKLIDLIAGGHVKILVPSQVHREWARNRDNKLAEAIGNIDKLNFKAPSIPRFMWEYSEIATLRKALSAAEKARVEAVSKARIEASTATTNADRFIQRVFSAAGIEADDPRVFQAAQMRMAIGDPPGKPNSLGDRLNWEHLLASELTDGDLHIISKDGDYFSPLDGKSPKHSLHREWIEKKNGRLFVHLEIKLFLSSKFSQFHFRPDTQSEVKFERYAREKENSLGAAKVLWVGLKEACFRELENASNSEGLEVSVKELEKIFYHLGESDLLRICKFLIKTDLIQDYDGDKDIKPFFENIAIKVSHLLDREEIEALESVFDIELHPEEFGQDGDPLIPDYGQMDLDLFDEEIGHAANVDLKEEKDEQDSIFEIGT